MGPFFGTFFGPKRSIELAYGLSEKAPSFVNVVEGNKMEIKPVIALDYPDIRGIQDTSLTKTNFQLLCATRGTFKDIV